MHLHMKTNLTKKWNTLILLLLTLTWLTSPSPARAETELNWVEGNGQEVKMEDVGQLKLGSDYVYLDGKDTQTFQKENGGTPSGSEIGAVFPKNGQEWALLFEYDETGHIPDDEKNNIDAKALLQSYKEGTEEANKDKDPADHLFIEGWDVAPRYDEKLHNLTWSILGHDANEEKVVNYNVRLLTREGYVSAVLISDPAHLAAARTEMENKVLTGFSVVSGQRYEDYNASTDKKSELGLTALVLGGAGVAVAKKVGLLALIAVLFKKFGIVIAAVGAGVWRFLRGRSKNKAEPAEQPQDTSAGSPPAMS